MKISRRMLIGAGLLAAIGGGIWTYQKLTFDGRTVSIDIGFQGAKGEWATSHAILPLYESFDVGLAFFDIAIAARADGLTVVLKRSVNELSWRGDLVFYTLETRIGVPISGVEELISIYDTTQPAADGGEGPLFVGNLKLTPVFRPGP